MLNLVVSEKAGCILGKLTVGLCSESKILLGVSLSGISKKIGRCENFVRVKSSGLFEMS